MWKFSIFLISKIFHNFHFSQGPLIASIVKPNISMNLLVTEINEYYSHCVRSVRIRRFSGPYFPSFGLNTGRYSFRKKCPYQEFFWSVFSRIRTECGLRIQSECEKIRTLLAHYQFFRKVKQFLICLNKKHSLVFSVKIVSQKLSSSVICNQSFRSSHQRCSIKKAVLKNFAIFTRKYLCWSNKTAGLKVCCFIKKRLQHRCLPMCFAKILRTSILKNIYERLLLNLSVYDIISGLMT